MGQRLDPELAARQMIERGARPLARSGSSGLLVLIRAGSLDPIWVGGTAAQSRRRAYQGPAATKGPAMSPTRTGVTLLSGGAASIGQRGSQIGSPVLVG